MKKYDSVKMPGFIKQGFIVLVLVLLGLVDWPQNLYP